MTLAATLKTERDSITSSNVAGMLPGSDPALKDEGGGADRASRPCRRRGARTRPATRFTTARWTMPVGIASLIEEAKRFKASGQAPKRSVLFLAVTAEEKGLIGSDYFAHNPIVPKNNLVADVNLDMPIITYKFEDVIAFGSDRSTLGPIVRKAAADAGASFSPDPMPEQGLFVRSDHYRFVQQGIPSVFLWPGPVGAGQGSDRGILPRPLSPGIGRGHRADRLEFGSAVHRRELPDRARHRRHGRATRAGTKATFSERCTTDTARNDPDRDPRSR